MLYKGKNCKTTFFKALSRECQAFTIHIGPDSFVVPGPEVIKFYNA